MIKRTLQQIQEMVQGSGLESQFDNLTMEGVVIDSRAVKKGNLYIPIVGEKANGHDYVNQARENGAVATFWQKGQPNVPTDIPVILVENTKLALQHLARAYKDTLNMKIIGITGSNGKTSTKDILASVLATTYKTHKTPGNLNSEFGMPLTILMAPTDTEIAVLEMGMRGLGEIKLLSDMVKPDATIITCIGEAHIELLGSRENISIAKFEITSGMDETGLFVYHGDEPLLDVRIAESKPAFKLVTFGENKTNDYYPENIAVDGDGMVFTTNQSDLTFNLSVLGKHNVMNALSAIATARHFGVTFEAIQKGLTQIDMSKMRMEVFQAKGGLTIINDAYNSSPTSVRATLELLNSLSGYNQKIAVLADMFELGDNKVNYHKEVGTWVNPEEIDVLFTHGDLAKNIYDASTLTTKQHFETKAELIDALSSMDIPGDICLIKGSRGMFLEEVVEKLK